MKTNAAYTLLIDAMEEHLPDGWTSARLNVLFLASGGEVEFSGTYLDANGDEQPLTTDFADEVTEAMQQLYAVRKRDGQPRANMLQFDLTAAGQYSTAYRWDQEMQDEEDHFSKGGTAREWQEIRAANYGDAGQ